MKTVLIISEYNPFHKGHKYQIDDIRKNFGKDTAIIALMSGSYTQRGDVAVMDKFLRAKSAVLEGVNLALLLPFPYSCSSAEFFATAGISIANSLGIVDVLAFGSECGDVNKIVTVAKNMLSEKFLTAFEKEKNGENGQTIGYPTLCEKVYRDAFPSDTLIGFSSPNNILAIEYVKALLRTNSRILPYTTKRQGAGYNDEEIVDSEFQSATAIRNLLDSSVNSALDFLPSLSKSVLLEALNNNSAPCKTDRLSTAILSFFRLNSPKDSCDIHDADSGLYNRLIAASIKATDTSTLVKLASTKKYTTARIKRAIWNSFFGVTSSDVRTPPHYTQVLAMDSIGQALLKRIKKTTAFPIVTKPSSVDGLDNVALRQKQLSDSSDFIFELSKPSSASADTVLKAKPFIKSGE